MRLFCRFILPSSNVSGEQINLYFLGRNRFGDAWE